MPRAGATIINSGEGKIGDFRESMLTLAQFQAQYGTGWVLADGGAGTGAGTGNIIGSRYNILTGFTVTPDCRGVVKRGKNHSRGASGNPDGDTALGTFQEHGTGSHTHTFTTYGNVPAVTNNAASSGAGAGGTSGTSANSGAANETRMRNITVNVFIKIN